MTALTAKTLSSITCAYSARRESRRTLLWKSVGLGVVVFHVNPSLSLPMVEVKEPDIISTVDQLSGESKPVILPLDGKEVIQGLKDVLVGMKVGGKRRALIPPSLGYVNEGLKPIPEEFGPRRSLLSHAKEPLVFEVQLLRLF